MAHAEAKAHRPAAPARESRSRASPPARRSKSMWSSPPTATSSASMISRSTARPRGAVSSPSIPGERSKAFASAATPARSLPSRRSSSTRWSPERARHPMRACQVQLEIKEPAERLRRRDICAPARDFSATRAPAFITGTTDAALYTRLRSALPGIARGFDPLALAREADAARRAGFEALGDETLRLGRGAASTTSKPTWSSPGSRAA